MYLKLRHYSVGYEELELKCQGPLQNGPAAISDVDSRGTSRNVLDTRNCGESSTSHEPPCFEHTYWDDKHLLESSHNVNGRKKLKSEHTGDSEFGTAH